jgi:hypothetical protein
VRDQTGSLCTADLNGPNVHIPNDKDDYDKVCGCEALTGVRLEIESSLQFCPEKKQAHTGLSGPLQS